MKRRGGQRHTPRLVAETGTDVVVLHRRMNAVETATPEGTLRLLEAVRWPMGEGAPDRILLFGSARGAPEALRPAAPALLERRLSLQGSPVIALRLPPDAPLRLAGGFAPPVTTPEWPLFAGRDVLVALREGERAEEAADWLRYHARFHGMTGAVIVNRLGPDGAGADFAAMLADRLRAPLLGEGDVADATAGGEGGRRGEADREEAVGAGPAASRTDGNGDEAARRIGHAVAAGGAMPVVVLDCPIAVGRDDLPPASHPFNAPDAPGKDRMALPPPDPWTAPLGEGNLWELVRWRFLEKARAVANIDLSDLLVLPATTFDALEKGEGAGSSCTRPTDRQMRSAAADHPEEKVRPSSSGWTGSGGGLVRGLDAATVARAEHGDGMPAGASRAERGTAPPAHGGKTQDDAPPTVFDLALASTTGVIQLSGRRVYPWRVRKGAFPHYADHVCRQFDSASRNRRWCIDVARTRDRAVWRLARIGNIHPDPARIGRFWRFMALRHPEATASELVPKTSLIEDADLLRLARSVFAYKPVRQPRNAVREPRREDVTIVTTMKNEGPFILEWIAYHRMIGVRNFLVYTNDCTDGTDELLDLLEKKGIVRHRDNPFRRTGLKPQHAALQAAEKEPVIRDAGWIICMDVDEFINIHVGEGRLHDLFAAIGDANMISLTWRLFGNSDIHEYRDDFIIRQFTRCAPEMVRKPHQAWGFKTLFRNIGIFKKLGVHRPKGLRPDLHDEVRWVNGSGRPMPPQMIRNAWRSTLSSVGYDLVTLNHYAVRSAESFLVKRDRGRVNHVDRDQGLNYWFRMNHNAEEDRSIQRMLPALEREFATLLADPEIRAAHEYCVRKHREKIAELKTRPDYAAFYRELTSPRMEKLSRHLGIFGSAVFLSGPEVVPDELVERLDSLPPGFFFTVRKPTQAA